MNQEPQIIKTQFKENIYQEDKKIITKNGYIYHFIYDDYEYNFKWYDAEPDKVYLSDYYIDDKELVFDEIPYQDKKLRSIISHLIIEENIDQFYIYINELGYTKIDFKKFI